MRLASDITYGKIFGADDAPSTLGRARVVRSWRLFRTARHVDAIFTNEGKQTPPGLILLAFLLRLTRQRKLILSEFIPGTRTGLKGRAVTVAYRLLLPRVLLAAQVMTRWERDDYAARYRIDRARLHVIPFYYFDDRVVEAPLEWNATARHGYLSTGRNACDWPTLIDAARGESWPLTIVAKRSEADDIRGAGTDAGWVVRHGVPRAEHDRLLAEAQLLIVALRENSVSSGHVRLMTAATYGTPVVLTSVLGVRGYEALAAHLVPPGDPTALRCAVNAIMSDQATLAERMKEVRDFAQTRPYSRYISEVREMLERATKSNDR